MSTARRSFCAVEYFLVANVMNRENTKTIGLCLSGGGHRATAFSLGALLYLADAGLHQQIQTISSVSGGSLTSGFLATREKSLHDRTPKEVEEVVAALAKKITGRPGIFWPAIGVLLALWGIWFEILVGLFSWPLSFWETQAIFLVALTFLAFTASRLCGGTLWGWWGTWFYVGVTLAALVIAFAIWWSETHWAICLVISYLALSLPFLRCQVAEKAFAATIFKESGAKHRLKNLTGLPRYVFCGTEMHTGEHALFTTGLVYIPYFGIGKQDSLLVSTAVQISANFPGGFPYRLLRQSKFGFVPLDSWNLSLEQLLERWATFFLILTDGGVHDNMGTFWFLQAPQRAAVMHSLLRKDCVREHLKDVDESKLKKQIDVLAAAKSDCLIVVNSSEPYRWKNAAELLIPLLNEVRTVLSINGRMYNQLGAGRKRSLRRQFFQQANSGALVSIGETPRALLLALARAPEDPLLSDLELEADELVAYRQKAERIFSVPQKPASARENRMSEATADIEHEVGWSETYSNCILSRDVPTTLRPLARETTAALLAHGYCSAMENCHLMLDFPLIDVLPSQQDFERLATGRPRSRQPKPVQVPEPRTLLTSRSA
jgi:hypothetical protein